MPEQIPQKVVAERVLDEEIVRDPVQKVSLPAQQVFHYEVLGRQRAVWVNLEDLPEDLRTFILDRAEADVAGLAGSL